MAKVIKYVSCAFCGHSITSGKFESASFPYDPLSFYIVTEREQRSLKGYKRGEGKGKRGFFRVEGSEKTILQLVNGTPKERQIAAKIINRVHAICIAYQQAGLFG